MAKQKDIFLKNIGTEEVRKHMSATFEQTFEKELFLFQILLQIYFHIIIDIACSELYILNSGGFKISWIHFIGGM